MTRISRAVMITRRYWYFQVLDLTSSLYLQTASPQMSSKTGKPVRVVRGYKLDSIFAPAEG